MELKKYKLGEIGEIRMCKRILKSETNPYFGIPFYKIGTFGKIADACVENGITMLLTADHGNSEVMVNAETGKPQTAHTTNKVPFVLINAPKGMALKEDGALCNIAPTVLELLDVKKPVEMTGESLIKFSSFCIGKL